LHEVGSPGAGGRAFSAPRRPTLWGAYERFEENTKGSIERGRLADLVILSGNPLTIEPMKISTINVMGTIKEGQTVYTRG
jgi:predicted amidohydrolase YtcJ